MANIAVLLKDEIVRLAKKTVRQEVEPVRSATALHRQQLASLKKQVTSLEREIARLRKSVATQTAKEPPAADGRVRFVAKGLKSLRTKLDLGAEDFGRLVGVSGQTIYSWEAKKTSPRTEQLAALQKIRGIGKKEARARLEELAGSGDKG